MKIEKITLLIVEDDEKLLDLLRDSLSENYNIISCNQFDVAKALIFFNHKRISLMISDINLSGSRDHGVELGEKAKKHGIKVILMTGLPRIADQKREIMQASDDFVMKPVGLKDLRKKIKKLLFPIDLKRRT